TDTTTFTGTYTIDQDDIDAGQRDNIATADSDESEPADGPNTTPLPQNPDISILKEFATAEVTAGGDGSSFTLVVTNEGNVTLSDAQILDIVDDRLTVTGVSGTVGVDTDTDGNNQTVEWTIATLAPGDSATITVDFTVDSAVPEAGYGVLNNDPEVPNSATVAAEAPQGDPGDTTDDITDNSQDNINIVVDIDLDIVKMFIPAAIEVPQGTFQKFTIVVTNNGPSDAVDVSVTDTVDPLLEVTTVSGTSGNSADTDGNLQTVEWLINRLEPGASATITVDYMTAPFLDNDSPYDPLLTGGDDFYFKFLNGSILEGTTRGDGVVYFTDNRSGGDGVRRLITGEVTIVRSLTRNDIIFDPPGSDSAFELHLSCSDPFTGGWGQSAGPVEGVDDNWQIAYFTIARFNNNGFLKSCGNVVNDFQVENTADTSGEDSFGTESDSNTAFVTVGPGIILDRLQTNGKRLTVRLNNLTGMDKIIRDVSAIWPESNGDLKKVWLTYGTTSDVVWQGTDTWLGNDDNPPIPDAFLDYLDMGWIGGTLYTGEAILRFDFSNKVAKSGYVIRVSFDDGTWLDISVDGNGGGKKGARTDKGDPVDEGVDSDTEVVLYKPTTLSAYPSPFTTQLNVDVNIDYEATVQVQLFDITGRLVKTLDAQHVLPGTNQLQLNIYDQVEEAIYVLKVNTGREIITAKVLGNRR
ncbi:MAG: DUF11 domain-containing protein, partial [Gammaproteobacteria bacterium]|nr:DUF11 domain-containing protein [Gammaproteobacteria bacterium]